MNEYDPKPSRVLPLEYARPVARERNPGSFALGCITSLAILFGLPIIFGQIASDPDLTTYGFFVAVLTILGVIAWAFMSGRRAFGRGLIWGPLMIVCLILLLVGVCALLVFGVGNIGK